VSSSWSPGGKVAVVTGAAGGIGAGLVRGLRAGGATVVATDVAESPVVDRTLDVRDAAAFDALVAEVVAEHRRMDLLVNNAGIAIVGDVERLSIDHWRRTIDVNLMGVVNGVHAAYQRMIDQGHGKIVNVASVAGLIPSPLLTAYSTTKHAIVGLSTSLRVEGRPKGVGVHVVCPGPIETALLDSKGPSDLPDATGGVDGRRYLTQIVRGRPYPVDSLVADVLAGIARDRAVIVAPASARFLRTAYRATPSLFLRLAGVGVTQERHEAP
jgi:NAD(P)-dependent dehydrogenase (short-subunit alcohol dehydrogenase family)